MKSYKKNPDVSEVFLPGIGKMTEGRIVTGDYDKYSPRFLVEVPNAPAPRTLESTPSPGPKLITEPKISAPVIPPPPPAVPSTPPAVEEAGDKEKLLEENKARVGKKTGKDNG
jgi:hypothetical protein